MMSDTEEENISGLSNDVIGDNIRIVKVNVISAINLAKKDIFGLSDPYCSIKLFRNDRIDGVIATVLTPVKKKTLNPKWDYICYFRVNTAEHRLLFEIFDENRLTRDDFLGESEIPLHNLQNEDTDLLLTTKDYLLHRRSTRSRVRGHIRLSLVYKVSNERNDVTDGFQAMHIAQDIERFSGDSSDSSRQLRPIEDGWESVTHEDVNRAQRTSSVADERDILPTGWEERQDANGRTFYVNHNERTTTWERPRGAVNEGRDQVNIELARRFSCRRHISTEDTHRRESSNENLNSSTSDTGPLPQGWEERTNSSGLTLYIDHNSRTTTWSRPKAEISGNDPPPNESSVEENHGTLERLHPDVPSLSEMALPGGWAMGKAQNGRVFFIDHNNRKTTWVDPRINPDLQETQDLGALPPGWEERALSDGRVFFIDHETQSTQWEDPRLQVKARTKSDALPYSRDYKRKYDFFRSRLKRAEKVPNKYEIHIRRNALMDDSYKFVLTQCTNVELLKTKLWIVFDGEVGLDYGGVSREWFYLLSREIFNPYYGLFEYSATDNYTLQINPNSGLCNDQHLNYFKFIGRVAGMAIYHGKLLDAFFIRPFYKMMLGKKITLQDMESVDSEYHRSLVWLLENDPEILDLRFQVEEEAFGQILSRELKSNGENIPVTNSNKQEYIDLVIKWRFVDRIRDQMTHFIEGFEDLIPKQSLQVFDEKELEYLLCGLGEIDIDDWRKNTNYRGGYHDKHVVVQWFWKAVSNFDNEMKARLLQFVTGTSRVPMNGFAELYGSNGPQKFAIERWGSTHQLPRAHTCFNRIDLPPYSSYHELREKLRLAIENTEGFEGVD